MAITSFSMKFDRELDASQYLQLLGYDIGRDPELKSVDKSLRDFIHNDLMCPSCGTKGAVLVSGAKGKLSEKNIKQPHFRFIANDGSDVHDEFCDLREIKPFRDISCEQINFVESKSLATKLIGEYVSKAIFNGFLNRLDIARFRVWHMNTKKKNMVKLSLREDKLFHYSTIYCRRNKDFDEFHPKLGEVKNLNWKIYALDRIAKKNIAMFDEVSKHTNSCVKEGDLTKLLKKHELIFDVRVLSDKYKLMLKLKSFISRSTGVQFKTKYELSFLDAFTGVLLYVNNWDYQKALFMFIDILNANCGNEPFTDNIVALNPFKDFQKLKSILNMNDVHEWLLTKNELDIELEKEVKTLKSEYEVWQSR
ncbi:hypothetical protein [Photobacterium damselae]|uniref:hypothetical protein n=1 Tax=Photobacterium damselae TaxID=38293 RepID=UPI001EFC303E|nr:hypothetical protein [Photobacterium damselae]MCG9777669.1 hypothetical protein [Photobacterium damselae]